MLVSNIVFNLLHCRNSLCLFGFVFLFPGLSSNAQEIKLDQTLKYINDKLGKKFSVEVQSQQTLFVQFYDDNGKLIRDDKVKYVKELNVNNIFYDSKETALIIPCKEDFKGCVDRNLYVQRFHRTYSRINFVIDLDEKTANGLVKAFTHLILLLTNPDYKSNEPFEK